MEFTVNTKLDLSGLDKIKEACKALSKTVEVGILHNPKEAAIGALQHDGGIGVYQYGPFEGEEVDIPPRPFLMSAMEHYGKDILTSEAKKLDKFDTQSVENILERIGEKAVFTTQFVIDEYSQIPNNSDRTVITKGKNTPLIDKGNLRASIEYEVKK